MYVEICYRLILKQLVPDFSENLDPNCYWSTDTHINYLGGKELSYQILNYIDNDFNREKLNKLIDEQMIIESRKWPTCDLSSSDNWSYSDKERLEYIFFIILFWTIYKNINKI